MINILLKMRIKALWNSFTAKTMGKKRYKSSTTTRNLRTVEKVLR